METKKQPVVIPAQEWFGRAVEHLAGMNKRAMLTEAYTSSGDPINMCSYSAGCAIGGPFMTEEDAIAADVEGKAAVGSWEFVTIRPELDGHTDRFLPWFGYGDSGLLDNDEPLPRDQALACHVQQVHDDPTNWDSLGLTRRGFDRLAEVAELFGLEAKEGPWSR